MSPFRYPLTAAMIALLAAASAATAQPAPNADEIHRRILTLDSHVDVMLPTAPPVRPQADLAQLRAGGVDVVTLAVFAGTGPRTAEGYAAGRQEAMAKLSAIKSFVASNPNEVALARTAAEVRSIVASGKEAVLISFLDAYWLNGDVTQFDALYAEGVRVAGLAHAGNTVFADSSRPGKAGEENGGLSELGKTAVRRLNDLGVLVDISQLTTKGVFQTLELSRAPVVASHSDVRGLVDVTRNLSDAEIDAIAAKGGVIQLTPFNRYLVASPPDYEAKVHVVRERYGLPSAGTGEQGMSMLPLDQQAKFMDDFHAQDAQATVKDFVNAIDYVVKRVGVDHVGIGSDFNHGAGVDGFDDESEAPNVTRELVARGYTEAQIAKIWGGNFLRVLAAADAAKR